MLSSRPPPFAYVLVLSLGAVMAPFLLSMDSSIISLYGRRNLSNVSLYSLKDTERYSQLQALEDIDPTIEERARNDYDSDRCSRVFVYLPDQFSDHGHGSQINTYIAGFLASAFLDRPMVLLEPPMEKSKYSGGSQFGCPVDAFHETVTKTSLRGEANWHVREDFPMGFSRLVDHPAWRSGGCDVPCADYTYARWVGLYQKYQGRGEFEEFTCTNPDGTEANVVVSGGGKILQWYREHGPRMTRFHPLQTTPEAAARFAANLGATPQEAEMFSNMHGSKLIWDYVLGLMNKAGFLKFRPWVARDVELFLKSFDLPVDEEYSAIHVRRGDKLAVEAREEVQKYWRGKLGAMGKAGSLDPNNLPTDYVPFAHYLAKWDGPDKCLRDEEDKVQVTKHNVYVATDDPVVVRREIAELPNHMDDNTVLWNDCYLLTFYFNPTDASSFHLNGDGEEGFKDKDVEDSCFMRYHRNVASIADMMLLSKARTFIGEYNSNWGRVIRTMRVRLNVPVAKSDDGGEYVEPTMAQGVGSLTRTTLTRTLDTRIAWGSAGERKPGL